MNSTTHVVTIIGRHHLHCANGLWYISTPGIGTWAFGLTYDDAVLTAETVR